LLLVKTPESYCKGIEKLFKKNLQTMFSIAGYIASGLIAISLLTANQIKFRLYNSIGNIFFIVYGISIHAWPVILTNIALLMINVLRSFKHIKTLF